MTYLAYALLGIGVLTWVGSSMFDGKVLGGQVYEVQSWWRYLREVERCQELSSGSLFPECSVEGGNSRQRFLDSHAQWNKELYSHQSSSPETLMEDWRSQTGGTDGQQRN